MGETWISQPCLEESRKCFHTLVSKQKESQMGVESLEIGCTLISQKIQQPGPVTKSPGPRVPPSV